jgi:hypothetical protein
LEGQKEKIIINKDRMLYEYETGKENWGGNAFKRPD